MAATHSCVFCDILEGRAPATVVYRDELFCVLVDIRPVNPGHLLVMPNVHAGYMADLPPATGGRLFEIGQRMAAAPRESELRCEGVKRLLADWEAAGQEVFHVHLHVVPRFAGDGFGLRYRPGYGKLSPRSDLAEVAAAGAPERD